MTHPLEALGLDRGADERAVKRAYAQRLRHTRPDVDPEGFQALNEIYQSALAFLRWQADNPDEPDEDDDGGALQGVTVTPGEESLAGAAPAGSGEVTEAAGSGSGASPGTASSPEPDLTQETAGLAAPFFLDLGAFLERMFSAALELDERELKGWIDRETAEWPITARQRIAHDVLRFMRDAEPEITPEHLETIVQAFGLDDVLVIFDPVVLDELRSKVAEQLQQRSRKVARLFHPDNRAELCQYMAQPEHGEHPPVVTRMAAGLLTSRRALTWARILRPLPFINRIVMDFLRGVDSGRLDAIARNVDRRALDFWSWAEERRHINRGVRIALMSIGFVAALTYVVGTPGTRSPGIYDRPSHAGGQPRRIQPPASPADKTFVDRIGRIGRMAPAESVVAYGQLLKDLPKPPWSQMMEQVAALAWYNRGVDLEQLGKTDAAISDYQTVDRDFASATFWPVQLLVAKALVNLAYIQTERGEHAASIASFQKVLTRYGHLRNAQFDLQAAKALWGAAAAFGNLGRPESERETLDKLVARFAAAKDESLVAYARRAQARLEALGRRGASPPARSAP